MKIGTYNLHYGGNGGDLKHWSLLLDGYELDLLLVQESLRPDRYAHRAAAHTLWAPVTGRDWGSALCSRSRIERELRLPSFAGWVTGAILDLGAAGPNAVFSVHAPSLPGKSYVRLLHEILDEVAGLGLAVPAVFGGDFNLVSAGERQETEALRTKPEERVLLERLYQDFDVVSSWVGANPEQPLQQTLRWTRDKAVPYHCDAIFVPSTWAVQGCTVLSNAEWDRLSDHNPVIAEVQPVPRHATESSA